MRRDSYQPIGCGVYSHLEVAILHQTPLQLRWHQDNGTIAELEIIPLDLHTVRDAGEFLLARDTTGQEHRIRLDRILNPPGSKGQA